MDFFDKLRSIVNIKKKTFKDGDNVIEITESDSERTMTFNSIVYSRVKKGIYTHQYWDFFVPIAKTYANPRILMIGLGAGTVPYQLQKLMGGEYSIDIVELSRPIIEEYNASAQPDNHVKVFQGDGADFVHNNKNAYDMIILDAFVDSTIPAQFFSDDFIANAGACLRGNGTLAINYLNPVNGSTNMEEYCAKLSAFFKVYTISVSSMALNTVILCTRGISKEEIISRVKRNTEETRENAYIFREYEQMKPAGSI